MASDVFSLIYSGDAIQDGEMSVAEIGPALVALGELFAAADKLFNGTETTVSTNVKADFKEGSFEVLFHIHQVFTEIGGSLLPGVFLLGADPLISQVLGKALDKAKEKLAEGTVDGLFMLLEKLRGKKPERIERVEQANVNVYVLGNNNSITVSQDTSKLYENAQIRELAGRVGSPLKKQGITKLRVKRESEQILELEEGDLPVSDEQKMLEADTSGDADPQQNLIVEILKPAFVDGKWSVSDGNRRFQVEMEDVAFKARVHAREIGFYDGDLYRVEMSTTQQIRKGKLSTKRKITRVIEPVKEAAQQSLVSPAPAAKRANRKFRNEGE